MPIFECSRFSKCTLGQIIKFLWVSWIYLNFIACLPSARPWDNTVFTLILAVTLRGRYYSEITVPLPSNLCHFTSPSTLIPFTLIHCSFLHSLFAFQPHHGPHSLGLCFPTYFLKHGQSLITFIASSWWADLIIPSFGLTHMYLYFSPYSSGLELFMS